MGMNLVNEKKICNSEIISIVDDSIDALCNDFGKNPTSYFTEHDLRYKFYILFTTKLGDYRVPDKNGNLHSIIHIEYPTPFRCHTPEYEFLLKTDDERTPKGGKYIRGHFDIAILNPDIISQLNFEEIRFQEYDDVKENLFKKVKPNCPMVLYAIEMMFDRGRMNGEGAIRFSKTIKQDHLKMENAKKPTREKCGKEGFIDKFQTIGFFYNSNHLSSMKFFIKDLENVRLQSCNPIKGW